MKKYILFFSIILFHSIVFGQFYHTYGPEFEQNWSTYPGTVGVEHFVGVNANGPVVEYICEDSLMYKRGYHELHYKGELLVKEYSLVQNYPNPFNPSTIIKYQIPKAGNVKLVIYDILGREITTLVNEFQNDGRYEVKFDASNLSSGIYIYRLEANDFVDSKKMMLVK